MPPEPRQPEVPERDPDDQRDRDLVARAQQGDRRALAEWLERYQDRLFGIAYRMVGDRDAAADITQDAMVQLIKGVHRYDGRARVSTWAYRIAMNVAVSHLRREGRRRHASLDAPVGERDTDRDRPTGGALLDGDEPDPFDLAEERDEAHRARERVQIALNALPDDHRAVLVLRDVLRLDYQEISEALGVPVGTAKSRVFRARIAFQEALGRTEGAPEVPNEGDAGPETLM